MTIASHVRGTPWVRCTNRSCDARWCDGLSYGQPDPCWLCGSAAERTMAAYPDLITPFNCSAQEGEPSPTGWARPTP